jgi:ABC-type sugar transport system permease subunit
MGSGFLQYLLVLPKITELLAVAGYPIVNSFLLSFQSNSHSPNSRFVGLQNYVQVLQSSEFRTAIDVTFGFTIIAVALETIYGLLIAPLINATFPDRGLV